MSTNNLSRRSLLKWTIGLGALGIVGKRLLFEKVAKNGFKGSVIGPNFKRGHQLFIKKPSFKNPLTKRKVKVAIIGSGVSGLSCAYHLHQLRPDLKKDDVQIYELEDHIGGNAHSYKDKAPWGAHYLPLPNPENKEIIDFLISSKIAKREGQSLSFDPYMIASAPKEKLFIYGRFQEGLVPDQNINPKEKEELDSFFKWTKELTHKRGNDGRYIFTIPMEESSKDQKWRELDKLSFKDYLKQRGFKGEALLWYVNYCCRDDYGTSVENISAWAGLHYFCSRRPKPIIGYDKDPNDLYLTWPEGNNFLIKKLQERIPFQIHNQCLCEKVNESSIQIKDFRKDKSFLIEADQIVLALPQFILKHLKGNQTSPYQYTPWIVANLHIRWDEGLGKELAWDNVNYHGKGLGFIVSHHQSLKTEHRETIITYYLPLTDQDQNEARKYVMGRTHKQWTEDILKDIEPMIFDIRERISKVDIWPWGHAMISPQVDFLFNKRKEQIKFGPNINVAHSDLSGLSLFEEAFYRGHQAALKAAKGLEA